MRGIPGTQQALTVALRVRPMNGNEINVGAHHISHVVDDKLVVLKDPNEDVDDILRVNRSREKQYTFDCAFGPQASQQDVFHSTTKGLINGVLKGYNSTVFAYGPTGAGKTYTMLGTDREPGIMMLTLDDLYSEIEANAEEIRCRVTISYLEIYNEMIRDLLNPSSGILELREDHRGVNVVGLMEVETISVDEIMELLSVGNSRRTCEPTAVNKTSSRSHAILQVVVEGRPRVMDISQEVKTGKLFMVDLAGSERAAQTKNKGKRMLEGAHINRSLLALGNCINALGGPSKVQYVNYRDSKLTRLLKDSLGGNCRTVMIAHVSPASTSYEESHNTLKYAERAKHIKTKTFVNVHDVSYHILQYTNIIADLRREIERLKGQVARERTTTASTSRQSHHEHDKMLADLKKVFLDQTSTRQELVSVECALTQNDLEIQKAKLKEEFLSVGENGDTDDNMVATVPDLTEGSGTLEEDEDRSTLSPHSLTTVGRLKDEADISSLRGERKRLSLQQRTLMHKLGHLNSQSTDLSERLQEVFTSGSQKDVLDMLLKTSSLEMHFADQSQVAATTGLHLSDCELLIEQLLEQNRACIDTIKRQREFIRNNEIGYPSELEVTYQKLLRQHRYLSNWHSWSTRLASIPSEAHLTDGTDDGDDEASPGPSPSHQLVPRGDRMRLDLISPLNLTISSVASLPSIPRAEQAESLVHVNPSPRPLSDNSSKIVRTDHKSNKVSPKRSAKSFLPCLASPKPSEISEEEEDRLPLLAATVKAKHKSKSRSTFTKLPSISSPPLIAVSRCSTMSRTRTGQKQKLPLVDSSLLLTTVSDSSMGNEAWGTATRSKAKTKTYHPLKLTTSQVTRRTVKQAQTQGVAGDSLSQHLEVQSPLPPSNVDIALQRKRKGSQKKRQLTLATARTVAQGGERLTKHIEKKLQKANKRTPHPVKVAFSSPYNSKPPSDGKGKGRIRQNLKISGVGFK